MIEKINSLKKGEFVTLPEGHEIIRLDQDSFAVYNGGGRWCVLTKYEIYPLLIEEDSEDSEDSE